MIFKKKDIADGGDLDMTLTVWLKSYARNAVHNIYRHRPELQIIMVYLIDLNVMEIIYLLFR